MPEVESDEVSRGAGDASDLLRELVPHRLPEALLREARAAGADSVALYVMDIDGSRLIRLAGDDRFPDRIPAPLGLGPELPLENLDQVEEIVSSKIPGATAVPMSIRDRAIGVLVTDVPPNGLLERLAGQAALALEVTGGYTDVIHRARRRKDINAAAEIQQNLLPPRIAGFAGAEVAGAVLPGYQIGGDFFDYADNDDGLWLAVGDAIGKGNTAASISSLAVGVDEQRGRVAAVDPGQRAAGGVPNSEHRGEKLIRATQVKARLMNDFGGLLQRRVVAPCCPERADGEG